MIATLQYGVTSKDEKLKSCVHQREKIQPPSNALNEFVPYIKTMFIR